MSRETILVVDDDENFNRAFLRMCSGETVVSAVSIKDGLAMAEALDPDCIFLDVRFDGPWKTGIDAIPEFLAVAPKARIVVMSSSPNDHDQRTAIARGAACYCIKTDLVRLNGVSSVLQAARVSGRRAPQQKAAARREAKKAH